MRLWLIVFLAMGIGLTVRAQTNTTADVAPTAASPSTADAAPAKAIEPLSTTSADNTRYLNDPDIITACTARVSAIDDKECDIIFIGDSITAGWLGPGKDVWAKAYASRHALNFGIEGDKTQNVLWRLSNMSIQNLKPKVAVVLVGENNTMNSTHEIADGVRAVLANTQEAFSGVKIILVSIPPNERAQDKMAQVNSLIRGYADNDTVFFLNLVPLMPPITTTVDGKISTTWKGIGPDRLHFDASGYQIWADALTPLLDKLMSGGH
jgi:lysophospholipase L1-like esterase